VAAACILASDGIVGLIKEGVTVVDDSVVKVDRPDGFARWDYIRVRISQLVISGYKIILEQINDEY